MPPPPVHVAPWLQPWWDFWVGITHALWWPAWSALFSALALGATIWLANSNARNRKRSEATFVEAVAITLDILNEGVRSYFAGGDTPDPVTGKRHRLTTYFTKISARKIIEDIELSKFPSSESLRIFLNAKPLAFILIDVAEGSHQRSSDEQVKEYLAAGEAYVRQLLTEARKIGGKTSGRSFFTHITAA
jgi:hypothetical protein